jgi:hypothetical protein
VAEVLVAAVEAGGVGAQEPFHARDKIRARRFQDEMKVVAHQTVSVDLPGGFLAGFPEGFEEQMAVVVIVKDIFAAVAAIHNVIDRAFVLNAEFSGHGNDVTASRRCVNTWDRPLCFVGTSHS